MMHTLIFLCWLNVARSFVTPNPPQQPSRIFASTLSPKTGKHSLGYLFNEQEEAPVAVADATQPHPIKQLGNPADVKIEDSTHFQDTNGIPDELANSEYPFALMMQGSARYIAAHADQTAVFHLPGQLFSTPHCDSIISDIALARVLGMKIVLVVGCRFDVDSCSMDFENNVAECHNSIKVTDRNTLRMLEEEAGFLRTEMERKLNRCLRMEGGSALPGNVVSGNFFVAQEFGMVRGEDFQYTGFTSHVRTQNIQKILDNNDIVLLTTVGLTRMGELVNVNGYHLSACVAAAMNAYKLVYLADKGSVLCESDEKGNRKLIQEIPRSFALGVTEHHGVQAHRTGFATFDQSISQTEELEPRASELLLHLAWACWALEQGVTRAHVVNPTDGALLEELFSSKNGANTCLYHDSELEQQSAIGDHVETVDWDLLFQAAARNGARVAKFG